MKKIYFIHENTSPIKVAGVFVQIPTDYVVAVGFIKTEEEIERSMDDEPENTVYMYDDVVSSELYNFLPGIVFDSYEEGCRVLVKILSTRTKNDKKINNTYLTLLDEFPEGLL